MKRLSTFRGVFLLIALLSVALQSATAETYTVNTSSDNVVANACANHEKNCSLRGAITEANANPGSTIGFSIIEFCGPGGCAIPLKSALPDISAPMSISGPTSFVIQRGSSAATNFSIFNVVTNGTVDISNLTIAKGTGGGSGVGGAIHNAAGGTVNITNCIIRDSKSSNGGGIGNSSTGIVNLSNSTITGNSGVFGGGIYNDVSGTVTVTNCTLTNNHAAFGGGICTSGGLTVTNTTLSGNSAVGSSSQGQPGGDGYGGAIAVLSMGTLSLINSTLFGNAALGGSSSSFAGAGRGGAIYKTGDGKLTATNCTIANNQVQSGGGLGGQDFGGGIDSSGPATVKSSIIALNTCLIGSSPDVNGSFTSSGFNLIGKTDGSTGFTAATDKTGTIAAPLDPKLDSDGLKDNGGPTQTVAVLLASPAIDKGSSAGLSGKLTTDQRGSGFPRIFDDTNVANASGGDGADIGAFELQVAQSTPTATPTATATPTPTATPTATATATVKPTVTATATPTPKASATPTAMPTVTPGLVANVSTRLPVGTGDNALIEGFIVQGPSGSIKKILVRAIGPSLVPFGIQDALANPTLGIFNSNNSQIASNDNWKTTQIGGIITSNQVTEINGSGLAPSKDVESAIIANLTPAAYTAVVRGANNSVGTGVVDAFDLSASSTARVANISTRGLIQPGDKLMIAGFIVQKGSVRVVVSAIGPSLKAFGIANALPDTTLQLRDDNGVIVRENDDWMTDQKMELESTGLQPSNKLEAALVQTIPPGQYTAQVRGTPETIGIGVVQIYFLQ